MEITGRVTADAKIRTLESGNEFVSFTIVEQESYKPKGSTERKQFSTFFSCAYFISIGVSKVLRKGAIVQLSGRANARAYTSNTGEAGASLNLRVSRIIVVKYAPKQEPEGSPAATTNGFAQPTTDDLPF